MRCVAICDMFISRNCQLVIINIRNKHSKQRQSVSNQNGYALYRTYHNYITVSRVILQMYCYTSDYDISAAIISVADIERETEAREGGR